MCKVFRLITVLFIIIFAGCALGPDYQRPEQELPENYRQSDDRQRQDTEKVSFAVRNWREIYQDEQLQWLIETGLADNLDLAVARSRVREARYYLAVSRSALFPQLDLAAVAEREGKSGFTSSSSGPENTLALEGLLSWEIDLWGRNRRSMEASEAQWMATEESRQAISVFLIGEIAAAYFELLDIDNRLKISERTVASREESIRIARLRKKGGVISKLEVQQAEVELASAKVTLPFLHKNRLIKENYLSILIGQAPGDIERRVGISEQALPPEVPVGLPGSLLQRRPDVRQAEQTLIAANAAIGIAKADFFPELTLTGAYGRESNELSDLLKSSGKTWIIGLDAIMPLFNAGKNRAQLAIAREQYEQASLNYRKIVLQSLQEVSDALESYSRSKEELEAHLDLVKSSQEYLRLATLRYYNGVLSYLDLLDAQRQLFNAELSLSESKRDRLVALVQLYKALGGGWQASEDSQG
jgi:NodT family efflux transporter outer membrane factor (OMF) lipoprotein